MTTTLTDIAKEAADKRYGTALWYAFGALDMCPDLAERLDAQARTNPLIDHPSYAANEFARLHQQAAYEYYSPDYPSHTLHSVQQAWQDYVQARLPNERTQ